MKYLAAYLLLLLTHTAMAQGVDSSRNGAVKGTVRDAVNDIDLQLATVAVYQLSDSSLLGYQLANMFGDFNIKQLPAGTQLKLVTSYTGYQQRTVIFTILPGSLHELGNIHMQRGQQLQEVVVTAPVRMNGDTLEFFADAFDVRKNAVVEDLLRKLPGITIWGDGKITINGRTVSQVLVNGKPFFGGNTKVAIRNIPKDAVEKIQVYQEKDQSVEDSVTSVNIRLKKNKSSGVFGKIAAGVGTDERYEADASIQLFNPKTEIGIVTGINNVNKVAENAGEMMEYSTFRSDGVGMDYQPDFSMPGANRSLSAGLTFQRDFGEMSTAKEKNRLSASYFIRDNNSLHSQSLQNIHLLGGDSTLRQQSNALTRVQETLQDGNIRYEQTKGFHSAYITAGYRAQRSDILQSEVQRIFTNDGSQPASMNTKEDQTFRDRKQLSFGTGFNHKKKPDELDVRYAFTASREKDVRARFNDFQVLDGTTESISFNRHYNRQADEVSHMLTTSYGDLLRWLPRRNGFSLKAMNILQLDHGNEKNKVNDVEALTGKGIPNVSLSNDLRTLIVNERPSLILGKSWENELPDRYMKRWSASVQLQGQYFYQKAVSDQAAQNFSRRYTKAIPRISASYANIQTGAFGNIFSAGFDVTSEYPAVAQLAGLVDSSDQSFIRFPNQHLRESDRRELSFGFKHYTLGRKNVFMYELNFNAGMVDNFFADSTMIDELGRGKYFTTNMNGHRYLKLKGRMDKAWKISEHQLQTILQGGWGMDRTPSWINGEQNWSHNRNGNLSMQANYTISDQLAFFLESGVQLYRARQESRHTPPFKNTNYFNRLAVSSNILPKLYLGSNITFNQYTTAGFAPNKFTIWNANIAYRFLKADNLELKCAAMDLLRQNRSVINHSSNLMLSRGEANVLQQYFMITLSYFPRMFGKRSE